MIMIPNVATVISMGMVLYVQEPAEISRGVF